MTMEEMMMLQMMQQQRQPQQQTDLTDLLLLLAAGAGGGYLLSKKFIGKAAGRAARAQTLSRSVSELEKKLGISLSDGRAFITQTGDEMTTLGLAKGKKVFYPVAVKGKVVDQTDRIIGLSKDLDRVVVEKAENGWKAVTGKQGSPVKNPYAESEIPQYLAVRTNEGWKVVDIDQIATIKNEHVSNINNIEDVFKNACWWRWYSWSSVW